MSELLDTAKEVLRLAHEAGARADVAVSRAAISVLSSEDGGAPSFRVSATVRLELRVFIDGKYATSVTRSLHPAQLAHPRQRGSENLLAPFTREIVSLASSLPPDRHRDLPDPSLYVAPEVPRGLFDPEGLTASKLGDTRLGLLRALAEGARSVPNAAAITNVTTTVGTSERAEARATSNGFEGEFQTTRFSIDAAVTVRDADGRRPCERAEACTRRFADLPNAGAVGRDAGARAMGRLGARSMASGKRIVIVESRVARALVESFVDALDGHALAQRRSFLEGRFGRPIGTRLFALTDDPVLYAGLGSRPWDSDAIAARRLPLVQAGVLTGAFIDVYSGRKLGKPPTAAAPSNLVVASGTGDLASLVSRVKSGLLVTGFSGGASDSMTGEFSWGASGFAIESGALAGSVSSVTVAGNHLSLWNHLVAVGGDPYPYAEIVTPSLVFDGVWVAGSGGPPHGERVTA